MIAPFLLALPLLLQEQPQKPGQKPEQKKVEEYKFEAGTEEFRFGTTVVASDGFEGTVYFIQEGAMALPNFKKLKPVGKIYANSLNVPPQAFDEGFPGITDRFEWFAIDYTAFFYISKPGRYTFALISDDGSKLFIDDKICIDNDGLHGPRGIAGDRNLKEGLHTIRVQYYQGPRNTVALMLAVAAKGEELHIFRCKDFRPPPGWVAPPPKGQKKK